MGRSRGRVRSPMPVQSVAYLEHTQRNTSTLPILVGLVFGTEMTSTPVFPECGSEFSPPAESFVKRLLLFSKGLFGAPQSGTRQLET
jgi:hypothetical protein